MSDLELGGEEATGGDARDVHAGDSATGVPGQRGPGWAGENGTGYQEGRVCAGTDHRRAPTTVRGHARGVPGRVAGGERERERAVRGRRPRRAGWPYPDAATMMGSHDSEKELLMNYSDRTDETTSTMDLQELAERAIKIHDLYEELNRRDRGRGWTREEFMLGFVGDIGDLAKLVMAQEGAREMPGGREALEHELADCLWSVLILAHHYHVNLGAAFTRTMDELDQSISERLSASEPVQPGLVPMMKTT
jgi:NTP pyrophosphatase (non-canonical NTP hydrolase)